MDKTTAETDARRARALRVARRNRLVPAPLPDGVSRSACASLLAGAVTPGSGQ